MGKYLKIAEGLATWLTFEQRSGRERDLKLSQGILLACTLTPLCYSQQMNNKLAILISIVTFSLLMVAAGAVWMHDYLPRMIASPKTTSSVLATTAVSSNMSSTPVIVGSENTSTPTSETKLISSTSGGFIMLADGSSVDIPAGALAQDETVTVSLSSKVLQPTDAIFIGVGNNLSLSLSNPLAPLDENTPAIAAAFNNPPATSTLLKFTINMGSDTARFAGASPAVEAITTDNESIFLPIFLSGSYDSSTNQAVVYVNPIVLELPEIVFRPPGSSSSAATKTLIAGMINTNCQAIQCIGK